MAKIKNVEDAVQKIKLCAIKEGEATQVGDYKTHNKYAHYELECFKYLYKENRLNVLYDYLKHENHHIRLSVAYILLPLYTEESKTVLYEIAKGDYGLSGLSAEMILRQWQKGELKYPFLPGYVKNSCENDDESSDKKAEVFVEKEESKEFPPIIIHLSQLFDCPPANDQELRNEDMGYYVKCNTEKKEIEIWINTFVNPYTQKIEEVYQKRIECFKTFENTVSLSVDEPSKLGFMQIRLSVPIEKATTDILLRIKKIINEMYREWKANESTVCLKVEYRDAPCYFEGTWWCPIRAVIKNRMGYERYDFSDEMKYNEEMWDIVLGEYDDFEYHDSFELITPEEFQQIWDKT